MSIDRSSGRAIFAPAICQKQRGCPEAASLGWSSTSEFLLVLGKLQHVSTTPMGCSVEPAPPGGDGDRADLDHRHSSASALPRGASLRQAQHAEVIGGVEVAGWIIANDGSYRHISEAAIDAGKGSGPRVRVKPNLEDVAGSGRCFGTVSGIGDPCTVGVFGC